MLFFDIFFRKRWAPSALINYEIRDIMNGVRLLEKTGFALKETPKSQKEGFFNFLTLLMTVETYH